MATKRLSPNMLGADRSDGSASPRRLSAHHSGPSRRTIKVRSIERHVQPQRAPVRVEVTVSNAIIVARSADTPTSRSPDQHTTFNLGPVVICFLKDAIDDEVIAVKVPDARDPNHGFDNGAVRRLHPVGHLASAGEPANIGLTASYRLTKAVHVGAIGLVTVSKTELR